VDFLEKSGPAVHRRERNDDGRCLAGRGVRNGLPPQGNSIGAGPNFAHPSCIAKIPAELLAGVRGAELPQPSPLWGRYLCRPRAASCRSPFLRFPARTASPLRLCQEVWSPRLGPPSATPSFRWALEGA
jgi:hypothetical protein